MEVIACLEAIAGSSIWPCCAFEMGVQELETREFFNEIQV
jgi:hypothetical protein